MSYTDKLEREAERSRAKSLSGRDIAPIPAVVNPVRRAAAEASFRVFCETYHKEKFYLAWSPDHLTAIQRIEAAIIGGGRFALGMPRGSGKTSLCEVASEWGVFTGRRRFIACIGADSSSAESILDSIKSDIETNELLLEDFPEICYPVRRLDGIAHRANGQLLNGERTHIGWEKTELILPTVKGSKASGAVVAVAGITGRVRGMKVKDSQGRSYRPDIAILDDPQTDESANSESQCITRAKIINGAVAGLSGPDISITMLMPCTVIREGDLADTYLNREKKPAWKGERFKIAYSLPTNEKIWEQYEEIRRQEQKERDDYDTPLANGFYESHREEMDAGCVAAWNARKEPGEVSAIQHLMNIKIDNEQAFWSEYMNQPRNEDEGLDVLKADMICSKLNGFDRKIIPDTCTRVTAFIDVQMNALFYVVCAWEENNTGYVIDYGTWPEQRDEWYQTATLRRSISKVLKQKDLEGGLWHALNSLGEILTGDWKRSDGANCALDRILVDTNWAPSRDVVMRFAKQPLYRRVVTPSFGRPVKATSNELNIWKPKTGDRVGDGWKMPKPTPGKPRHVLFNTNFWKSSIARRIVVPIGQATSLSLWGDNPTKHALLASHWTAEYSTRVEANGNVVDQWEHRPERMDNHWWDGVVGCAVGASIEGISPLGRPPKKKKRKRIKLSEMMGAMP